MSPVVTEKDGDVLLVTLDRPESLNALNHNLILALKHTWAEAADAGVRAVVLTGKGRGFCPGADLKGMGPSETPGGLEHTFNPMISALVALEKPVICAVNGPTAGAGLGLACAGDIRIAARSATFTPAFARIGVVPDAGATFLVTRLLGYSRAFDFFCSGEKIDAEAALTLGLVNEVVDDDILVERALERAHAMAAMPGAAVALTKQLLDLATRNGLAEMLAWEARVQPKAVAHPERAAARARVVQQLQESKEGRS